MSVLENVLLVFFFLLIVWVRHRCSGSKEKVRKQFLVGPWLRVTKMVEIVLHNREWLVT